MFDISVEENGRMSLAQKVDETTMRIVEIDPGVYWTGLLKPVFDFCEKIVLNPTEAQLGTQEIQERIKQELANDTCSIRTPLRHLSTLLDSYDALVKEHYISVSTPSVRSIKPILIPRQREANDNISRGT